MLAKLKTLLGITNTSKDALLNLLIAQAEADFEALTNNSASTAENVVIQMVIVRYNTLGAEGLSAQNFNGVSESFSGYSDDLLRLIRRYRKVMFI